MKNFWEYFIEFGFEEGKLRIIKARRQGNWGTYKKDGFNFFEVRSKFIK